MLYYIRGGATMATLLIVEDDRKTNAAICEYLKPAGHKVIPAYDGGEALQLFRESGIDLVVLDIMLPHISGLSKEIDLLRLLVEHRGLVLTRSQILDELWGADYPIIDRTVDTYIKNLRKKLRLDCIVTVKGIGYKYEVQL